MPIRVYIVPIVGQVEQRLVHGHPADIEVLESSRSEGKRSWG